MNRLGLLAQTAYHNFSLKIRNKKLNNEKNKLCIKKGLQVGSLR
ncbi:hypothetical protein AAJ76_2000053344 [Vairimorpha ceranae]|uniref:Uncharacterized protein n=1 Tax=Vairimorpha ceranae TaxID=40302 RepID=A0A0F9WRE3_9MICR|nr:hypothetical protein AAJ76_2000053344 [Vairimorpha ceranae]KKO75483.1 hypothetical protein AAJ76_2000053344 [Vairimorpha ceranae]